MGSSRGKGRLATFFTGLRISDDPAPFICFDNDPYDVDGTVSSCDGREFPGEAKDAVDETALFANEPPEGVPSNGKSDCLANITLDDFDLTLFVGLRGPNFKVGSAVDESVFLDDPKRPFS